MKPRQLTGGAILNRAPISSDATGAFSLTRLLESRSPRGDGRGQEARTLVLDAVWEGRSAPLVTRLRRPVARDLRRIHGYFRRSNTERTSNDEQRRPSDHSGKQQTGRRVVVGQLAICAEVWRRSRLGSCTARADIYDISVVPAPAHTVARRYPEAIEKVRELARQLGVNGWYTGDQTHYALVANHREPSEVLSHP